MVAKNPAKIGKYDIVDMIGRGGMGVVYKAMDPAIGRLVAIKVMTVGFVADPDLLKRFYREAQSAGNLQHANIVTVYELGELEGIPYLVMEFLEGESLDRIIQARRELPLEETLGFVVQICNGLHYAHERNVVHRDIKPGNIMITANSTVKIVDFGLAHVGAADGLTRPGQVMGSINYMSPEQINGQPIDRRTDIFAAGVVLYQLLAKALPFQGADTGSTLLKIIHEPPAPLHTFLKEYPRELDNVIQHALAKDREARYATAEDFAMDLGVILEHLKQERIECCLQKVQELMVASNLEAAQEQLRQVLKLDRQHRRGNELMREVRQRIQKRLAQQQAEELRSKAEAAFERQDLDDALASLQAAVKLDDSNSELIKFRDSVQEAKTRRERIRQALQRAESAQASGDLEDSLKMLEEVLALDPNHADAIAMQAAVSEAIRQRERRKRFQELTERARKQIAAREFQAALEVLKEAGGIDAGASLIKELTRAAAAGLEQERIQRAIERLVSEAEDALNRDDYRTVLAKTDEGLRQFGDDRRLQQLKKLAEKQREAAERRARIAEQIAAARKLLDAGKTADALLVVEAASREYPSEPALQSMLAMAKETLAREKREREQTECTQKAKELLRRKQYSEAIQLLESARERLKTTDLDDLIQFARDDAAMYIRRQKLAAITEQANQLISAEEYERAIEFLHMALVESPDAELQAIVVDAEHRLADFRRGVAEVVTAAQHLMAQKRAHEAVRLLESQPASYAKLPDFSATLDRAREEVRRIEAVSVTKEQARAAMSQADFEKAASIIHASRNELGDVTDLDLLDQEIQFRRAEVFGQRVESAVADARTLLIGRSYRSALEILNSVSQYVPAVPAELQAQYDSLRNHALAGKTRQESEAKVSQPMLQPEKGYGPSSGVTMPQTHWTMGGATAPALPPDVAPPPPGMAETQEIQSREVNIIGQGDSSSVHDRGLFPLGPAEIAEPRIPPPEQALSPTVEISETISTQETQLGELDRTPADARELSETQLLTPSPAAAQVPTTRSRETQIAPPEKSVELPLRSPIGSVPPSPVAFKRGLAGRPMIGLAAAVLVVSVVVAWNIRSKAPAAKMFVPLVTVPEGATVRINQKDACVTPNCRISLAAGHYDLGIGKAGYEPVTLPLTIKSSGQSVEPIHLQLKPLKMALQVSTNFQSGRVALNEVPVASLQDGQFLMPDLPVGSHLLSVHGPDADASVGFEVEPGRSPTITKGPEAKQAHAVVISGLESAVHIACNCTEPVALDGKTIGNIGPAGLDIKDVSPGTHQLKIGAGDNQHTVTVSTGAAPMLDVFLASERNVGTLVLETKQTGVDIFVNGKKYGRPTAQPLVRIPLDAKTYQVEVHKQGYRASATQQAEIRRNQDTKLVFDLEPEPATLLVRGAPPGTQISIDGNRIGATGPLGRFSANVSSGEHVVEFSKAGFSSRQIRQQFPPGETVTLNRQVIQMAELQPTKPAQPRPAETRAPEVSKAEAKPPASVSTPPAPAPSGPAQDWERIASSRDTAVLDNFRNKYPDTPFAKRATQKIEQLDWESAKSAGDAGALQAFLRKYPNGSYSESAKADLANLEAQRTGSERQAVRDVLRRYAEAYDSKDAGQVAAVYPRLNNKDLKKIRDSFKAAQSVRMTLRPMGDLQINGEKATVTCSRSLQYTFKDAAPNPIEDTVRVELSKKGGLWIIDSVSVH